MKCLPRTALTVLAVLRYGSMYVQSDDEHFKGYVADIDRFYSSGRR
jgi:hypothetical protein